MEERRDSMLAMASQCFQSASRCGGDEEEWLIHYMLGKIAEKHKLPPKDYLHLYKKVMSWITAGLVDRLNGYWECMTSITRVV